MNFDFFLVFFSEDYLISLKNAYQIALKFFKADLSFVIKNITLLSIYLRDVRGPIPCAMMYGQGGPLYKRKR